MNRDENSDLTVHTSAIPVESISEGDNTPPETNVIVTELSEEAQLKLEVIQSLLEPCDTCGIAIIYVYFPNVLNVVRGLRFRHYGKMERAIAVDYRLGRWYFIKSQSYHLIEDR